MVLAYFNRRLADYALSERGASASEYALLLVILGGCAVVLLQHLGRNMSHVFTKVAGTLGNR
jgi:Flp pilus assembly pilin Flp